MLLTSGCLSEPHLPSKPVPGSHPAAELHRLMLLLYDQRISFIPVFGRKASNYDAAKTTWVKWKTYQKKLPTHAEIRAWSADPRMGGLAIVNGGAFGVFSTDTDTLECETAYQVELADLLDGYRELSPRNFYHRFYRTAEGVIVPGVIKIDDFGELRGEGSYTVIAPTHWQDKHWRALEGDLLSLPILNQEQVDRLAKFYHQRIKYVKPKRADRVALSAVAAPITPHLRDELYTYKDTQHIHIDYEDLQREIAARLGVTCYDENGYSNPIYCPFHDDEHPSASWNRDFGALKCHAGCTTLGFKASGWVGTLDVAAKLGMIVKIADLSPLHLTTTKAILKRYQGREGDTVVKFLLTMRLNDYSDGCAFSEADAVKACAGVVGRKGVRVAIRRLIDFCPFASKLTGHDTIKPIPRTKNNTGDSELCSLASGYPERAIASSPPNISRNTCSLGNKNRGRGRPAAYFMMPTEAMLAAGLGVEIAGRLTLTLDELKTRALTDLLLEDHIMRLSGKYAYKVLAKELGKASSTVRRHAVNNPAIERKSTFNEIVPVDSVEQVRELTNDSRGVRGGRYVQNEYGRKFAATPENVEKALKRGDELTFYELGVNQFSVRQVELDDAERQRQLIRLKERALRWLGKLAHAGLLKRERAEVRADLREAANMGDTSKLERFIESAKKALRDAKGQANPADSDPLIAAAKELGAVVKPVEAAPEPPPVLYECPNCGQTYAAAFAPPPDMCDFCNDLTTWRLKTPTDL